MSELKITKDIEQIKKEFYRFQDLHLLSKH